MTSHSNDHVITDSRSHDRYAIEVSDEHFRFSTLHLDDPRIVGLQVAEVFDRHPARDFVVLHHLSTGELETLRPGEEADISGPGPHRFFVIEGGDSHRFTIAGLSMEWPRAALKARHVKFLALAKEEDVLVQVTEQGHVLFADDDEVSLKPNGAEEFLLRKLPRTVTVYYKQAPHELERRAWSTEELIERFKVPEGYKLDLIAEDCEFIELKSGETLKLKEGMEFTSHAPRGQSS